MFIRGFMGSLIMILISKIKKLTLSVRVFFRLVTLKMKNFYEMLPNFGKSNFLFVRIAISYPKNTPSDHFLHYISFFKLLYFATFCKKVPYAHFAKKKQKN